MRSRNVLLAAFLLLGCGLLGAQETSFTLNKIRNSAAIYVGYGESSSPFSYTNADGRVLGYSIDLCARIVDAVSARLELPGLALVPVPTTAGSRQMMLESGTTDLQCDAVTNTLQRQRSVAFSVTTYAAGVKALVRRDSGIASIRGMQGKRVVTTAGTTSDSHIKAVAARQGVSLMYQLARSHGDSLRQVLDGRADVLVLDDVLLQGLLVNLADADAARLVVLDESISVEPYAIMFRRNDSEFKKLVDETLTSLMKSGEFARIYDAWLLSPIPPENRNLGLPMSGILRQLMLTPNDKGV